MMWWRLLLNMSAAALVLGACGGEKVAVPDADPPGAARKTGLDSVESARLAGKSRIGTVDDVMMLPVPAPDVSQLSETDRKFLVDAWRKADEADDACYETTGPQGLRVRHLLEGILRSSEGGRKKKFKRYLTAFWLHKGNTDRQTGTMLQPRFIPGELAAAAQTALEGGAAIDLQVPGQTGAVDADRLAELERLMQWIRPYVFGAAALPGQKPQSASQDASLTVGDDTDSADGTVDASKNDDNRSSCLPALVMMDSPVLRAETEAVFRMSQVLENRIREVGGRKSTFAAPVPVPVRAVNVLYMGGSAGPEQGDMARFVGSGPVFEDSGRGRVFAVNLAEVFFESVGTRLIDSYSSNGQQRSRRKALGIQSQYSWWVLREALGHGVDGTETRPRDWFRNRLGTAAPVLASLRADLAALYMAFDPDIQRIGLVPAEDGARAFVEEYLFGTLTSIAISPDVVQSSEGTARLIVFNHLLDKNVLTDPVEGSGDAVITLPDFALVRPAIEELLAEVRRIRFAGDGIGAREMLTRLGDLRASVKSRLDVAFVEAEFPRRMGFIFPLLQTRVNDAGEQMLDRLENHVNFYDRQILASGHRKQ